MEIKKIFEHSSFWNKKIDDECMELATDENGGIDVEQALLNVFKKEIAMEFIKNTVTECLNEAKQVLMEKYVREGVHEEKIIITKQPSTANWSLSRKCLVGENGVEALEIIDEEDGSKRLSFQNNVWISMSVRTTLTKEDIDEINNSNGIVCTSYSGGFRYGFIPS